VIAALLAVIVFAGPALASTRVTTTLSGANETPPNASTATGVFNARVTPYKGKLCYTLSWEGLSSNAIAAHIHEAPPGTAGPIVVPLTVASATSGTTTECKTGLDHALLRQIARHPTRYYVNVHSENFPGGEIRGQQAKGTTN
jgi:Cu/Zn superoxide dismutase